MEKKADPVCQRHRGPGYMKWFTNKCDLIFAPTPGMQNRIRENGTEVSMAVLPTGLDDSFYIEDEEKTKTIRRQYLGKRKTDIYSVPSQGWRKKKIRYFS